ncbi:MAG: 23S rRNA (adenine(2503)-C(2))-methyltransferase RlmN [Verrucomicrobiota bacterium]|jgi:23S rRNA (adenine2503-C2)-methyltransferase|nr:23S rRNA (adenine(2503)-C(2))-methyltransferase RlmN [Verrucomicrobiota bacterium]MDP6252585.1 23S rRNA (adenine(2503)-C(2))-methyltransferase RlmN [Verrucomicrobiota bacterium]MDP7178857.1 23S rRNA (adenine(2503)-C(2))-methyltransferase RlmN [Verrucomicrobiota bacterium]MDP7292527.1 23S rRNA (adenine(2503)-C(2))-methyltransferase RlmN [Verrucomicrobiota bacterium]
MSDSTEASRELRSLNADEAERVLTEWGHKSYRATQLLGWLYKKRASSIDEMSDLPLELRDQLSEAFSLQPLELTREQCSRDGTVKFLWRLADGELIESVLIPASIGRDGSQSGRRTLCVSSQVGCAYGCTFCASGLMGYRRNLDASEIVDQVLAVERWHLARGAESPKPEPMVNNIVMMGMGEPLANYDNLIRALEIFNSPWGLNIGARKITVSTSGLAPQIRRLSGTPQQYHLAISLHGATDEVRDQIMPVNRKYPLEELVSACEAYQQAKGRMIWVEYILIDGVNTGPEQVEALSSLAKRLQCKVNLIPYNPVDGIGLQRPSDETVVQFRDALYQRGVRVTMRIEKGTDIDAACGQLRLKSEKQPASTQALGQAG